MNQEKQARTGMEIAIIGMSGRFPGAKTIDRFWDNLKNGVESISYFSDEELEEAGISNEEIKNPGYVKAKGVLEDIGGFDSTFFNYTPKEAFVMDPQVRLFHECAWEALENAGYDTASYDGLIGLYAGASTNYYWMMNALLLRSDSTSSLFENVLLNNRDYLSTRVAYKLDLKGPGVMIQTACSTSLTAVHMAVQALLMGECEMALAGGVTVLLPQKTGYIYRDDMIFSPDGHCRAFDARAQGFVDGNGIGILVLKRLEEAAADGDYIHAVILGSAANNDGKRRVGYTAPGAEGQAAVIRAALQMAEVEPESIGYIETHGTGTNMGDAIEIEALKRAFNTNPGNHTTNNPPREQYCALGSVKTNVGHLDAAAGAAGLIKTVLALKHRLIPPSLNFTTPNPKLGLEDSPFYINHRLTPWNGGQFPLRAGVSSFGIGGTNVHVILEEAPRQLSPLIHEDTSKKYQLILLSARTKPALERMTKNLGEYLEQNPGINLTDAAYTLQVGRSALTHRGMLVAADRKQAVHALLNPDSGGIRRHFTKEEDRPVVFMFPGLGSQYVNMGLDLYRSESVFREEMDRCFEILNNLVEYDIKEILYPSSVSSVASAAKKINQTEIAQWVVFIFEYALAKLLMHRGIKPYAMIGYSFGEYSAACISGVLSLEDALKVIKARGRLLRSIPPGAMLSVPLPEEKLKPFLFGGLSTAIDNGASCIVSGSNQAIDTLEKQMKEKRYLCVRLEVSHAIHSLMMDSILEEFAAAVGEVTLNKPQIPYISNVTGTWITIEDAKSPRYWADHLRETVRFARGLEELVKKENVVLVEVGPGVVLSTLAQQHIDKKSGQLAVNLLRSEEQKVSDMEYLLRKIGRLWLYGKKIHWPGFYPGEKRYRIPLPTYSFDSRYYSVEVSHLRGLLEGKLPKVEGLEMEMEAESQPTDLEAGYAAPRHKVERIIVDMWEEILGIKPIGIHNNFFEMGGDSLKGIAFINKFKELLGEIIHITVIFDAPTVAELSVYFSRHYPEGYARIKDEHAEITGETGEKEVKVTEEKIVRTRGLIPSLTPLKRIEIPKNPPAAFILSAPRTGSTLFRVLLGGHPMLFAPPELNLLEYADLQERKDANTGHAASHLQGTLRAIMQIKECSAEEAQEIMERCEKQGMTVKQFYRQLQEWIGDRLLVDKSPGYAINLETLNRAEVYFRDPLYIHLMRHPYGMIRSYMESKLDLLMDRQMRDELSYSRRELAEMTWVISEQNIMEFLKHVPSERQLRIKFEDLVAEPEIVVKDICRFLHLEFHPGMLQPYREKKQRMTDGVYSEGIMLGDMKFHRHKGIDPKVADTWKNYYQKDFLGGPALEIAESFGYKTIRELENKREIPPGIIPGAEHGSARQLLRDIDKFPGKEEAKGDENISIEAAEKREFYPLSASQKHMYILNQFISYNVPVMMVIEGRLDRGRIENVFQELVKRHDSLRTSFEMIKGEPIQKIHDEVEFKTEYYDSSFSIPHSFVSPFDLSRAPLLRVGLIKQSETRHLFLYNIHHIIFDGVSMGILAREFMNLYEGTALPELKIQYKDFSQWEQGFFKTRWFKEQEKYWLKEFPAENPVLNMPTDFPRPSLRSFAGDRVHFEIKKDTFRALKTLGSKMGASPYMFIMAVYNTILFKYTGLGDIVVGTIIAGRDADDVKNLAGVFINTLALRNYPRENKTFNEFLKQVRNVILNGFQNQRYPFGKLLEKVSVKKDLSRTPLFDVLVIYQNLDIPELEVKGLHFLPPGDETVQTLKPVHAQHDITLWVNEGEEELQCDFEYCTSLFKKETMERFARHFLNIVREILKDPGITLSRIDMMGEEERKQVLIDFNATRYNFPVDKTIHGLFEQQAERIPDQIALVGSREEGGKESVSLTYKELNLGADQLAQWLKQKSVGPDIIVAIMSGRSVEIMIGVFGILKAGGAYLPIDPDYPEERIQYMLKDSGAKILVTDPGLSEKFKKLSIVNCQLLMVNEKPPGSRSLNNYQLTINNLQLEYASLAYLIYTSGSTGRPKGVMVQHDNFLNAAFAWRKEYRLDEIEVNLLQVASFSFDVFAGDYARVFINGGKLVICPEGTRMDPPSLYILIRKQRITLFESTPSLAIPFMEYVNENQLKIDNLQLLIVGSDSCRVEDFKKLISRFGNRMRIINSYGVTETTIDTSYYEEPLENIPPVGNVPIGKPMPNMKFYIMNSTGNLQPIGIPGELWIGGDGVARGYLNNPELTCEKFKIINYELHEKNNQKLLRGVQGGSFLEKRPPGRRRQKIYKTGDLARWLSDGNVEFLGRIDSQVKIRGYRIEVKEIESILLEHKWIKEAVVLACDGNLCAYIVPVEEQFSFTVSQLRKYLSGQLPGYMIPAQFIEINEVPLSPNGKIDMKALAQLDGTIGIGTQYAAPTNEVEEKLAKMWSEVLMRDRPGIYDNFFDLGGQSLLAMELISMINETFAVKVPLIVFFQSGTIQAIAGLILKERSLSPASFAAVPDADKNIEVKKTKKPRSFADVKFKKKQRQEIEIEV